MNRVQRNLLALILGVVVGMGAFSCAHARSYKWELCDYQTSGCVFAGDETFGETDYRNPVLITSDLSCASIKREALHVIENEQNAMNVAYTAIVAKDSTVDETTAAQYFYSVAAIGCSGDPSDVGDFFTVSVEYADGNGSPVNTSFPVKLLSIDGNPKFVSELSLEELGTLWAAIFGLLVCAWVFRLAFRAIEENEP